MKSLILVALSIVAVTFSTTPLQAGIEVKAVTSANNSVEVQSMVEPQQRLSHWFGIVDINSYNYADFVVTNRSQTFLGYEGAYISGIDFRARTNCTNGLMPGQQCQFSITYNPFFEGYHYGMFELYFSENNQIIVDTSGEARRRW